MITVQMIQRRKSTQLNNVNYQNTQVEFYQSGLRRISEAKRVRMPHSFKLTPQEQDAFDYFRGTNFYKYYQNVKTSPNIYDTRRSFLLKMENQEMHDKFLKAYNRKKIRLPPRSFLISSLISGVLRNFLSII